MSVDDLTLADVSLGEWQLPFRIDDVPADEPLLVWLTEPMLGSRLHVAVFRTTASGSKLGVVAGQFVFDLPGEIFAWARLFDEELTDG